jgi:hypothetical protein
MNSELDRVKTSSFRGRSLGASHFAGLVTGSRHLQAVIVPLFVFVFDTTTVVCVTGGYIILVCLRTALYTLFARIWLLLRDLIRLRECNRCRCDQEEERCDYCFHSLSRNVGPDFLLCSLDEYNPRSIRHPALAVCQARKLSVSDMQRALFRKDIVMRIASRFPHRLCGMSGLIATMLLIFGIESLARAQTGSKSEIAKAIKEHPWENSLGMEFVSVAGTKVLISVWDTRVQDYKKFVQATGRDWPKPSFKQGPTHPVVNVS